MQNFSIRKFKGFEPAKSKSMIPLCDRSFIAQCLLDLGSFSKQQGQRHGEGSQYKCPLISSSFQQVAGALNVPRQEYQLALLNIDTKYTLQDV